MPMLEARHRIVNAPLIQYQMFRTAMSLADKPTSRKTKPDFQSSELFAAAPRQ
jgi:hypothetical protein